MLIPSPFDLGDMFGPPDEALWGHGVSPTGIPYRVTIYETRSGQFANFLIPANGFEMGPDCQWEDFLLEAGLVSASRWVEPDVVTRCVWDRRDGLTWVIGVALRYREVIYADCLVPTEPCASFMAWRGPKTGNIVRRSEAAVTEAALTSQEGTWWSYGDELVAGLVRDLLSTHYFNCQVAELIATATDTPGAGGFDIQTDFGHGPDSCLHIIRHQVARLYEWIEHCQGRAWRTFTLKLTRAQSEDKHEWGLTVELTYD